MPDPDDLEFTLAVADTVAVAVENIRRRQELAENLTRVRTENVELRERLGIRSEIIGRSAAIRQVTEEIARAAASNATVLIRGESGVGKELVARGVHYNSPRRENVFVCLNCAALSADLLASELFGHERGAFTGATERKIGKFEAAHKGTLMLDEIGEMSPGLQAKFLRVLEAGAHFADFVEHQRSLVGGLELADLPLGGAGERPALVAEQLARQQIGRQGGAIQAHEDVVAPRAVVVDGRGRPIPFPRRSRRGSTPWRCWRPRGRSPRSPAESPRCGR